MRCSGTWSAVVEEWLEIPSHERWMRGGSRPSCSGAEIAQVGGLLGVKGGIWRACRRDVPPEVSKPPPLPIQMFENAQTGSSLSRGL
jgi:hypothetical protein